MPIRPDATGGLAADFVTTAVGEIAVLASFDGGPPAPLVHFAHATGMCAELYRLLLERLMPHASVVAGDARGHGATRLPADPATLTDWARYADDLAALLTELPAAPRMILAGHSMGATVSMLLAARLGDRIAAVVTIEPAFVPLAAAAAWGRTPMAVPLATQAKRRRAVWPSRAAMRDAYHGRGVFAAWADADLDAYLARGVRDRADGQVELACAPAWEAATFASVSSGLEGAISAWHGPLTLLHGTVGSTVMAVDAAAIANRPDNVVRAFAGADHFLPLAQPQAMVDAILAVL